MLSQTSPPLRDPQPLPTAERAGQSTTTAGVDAFVYPADADTESVYRGWDFQGGGEGV